MAPGSRATLLGSWADSHADAHRASARGCTGLPDAMPRRRYPIHRSVHKLTVTAGGFSRRFTGAAQLDAARLARQLLPQTRRIDHLAAAAAGVRAVAPRLSKLPGSARIRLAGAHAKPSRTFCTSSSNACSTPALVLALHSMKSAWRRRAYASPSCRETWRLRSWDADRRARCNNRRSCLRTGSGSDHVCRGPFWVGLCVRALGLPRRSCCRQPS